MTTTRKQVIAKANCLIDRCETMDEGIAKADAVVELYRHCAENWRHFVTDQCFQNAIQTNVTAMRESGRSFPYQVAVMVRCVRFMQDRTNAFVTKLQRLWKKNYNTPPVQKKQVAPDSAATKIQRLWRKHSENLNEYVDWMDFGVLDHQGRELNIHMLKMTVLKLSHVTLQDSIVKRLKQLLDEHWVSYLLLVSVVSVNPQDPDRYRTLLKKLKSRV